MKLEFPGQQISKKQRKTSGNFDFRWGPAQNGRRGVHRIDSPRPRGGIPKRARNGRTGIYGLAFDCPVLAIVTELFGYTIRIAMASTRGTAEYIRNTTSNGFARPKTGSLAGRLAAEPACRVRPRTFSLCRQYAGSKLGMLARSRIR